MELKISAFPRMILLALLLNAAISPVVYAASDGNLSRGVAYALSLLGLVVVGLAVYLGWVIVQPERF
jgi:K+-transporting ATPase KdpF subunit